MIVTVVYQLSNVPSGRAGVRSTLRAMSKLVRAYKAAPLVRETALSIVKNIPSKNWPAEIAAIHRYVCDTIRYTKDIRGVETLQSPVQTLRLKQGDCDDHSILIASLLEAISHPTRFVAIGSVPDSYSHVFTETKVGPNWLAVETPMVGWPCGRRPKPGKGNKPMVEHN